MEINIKKGYVHNENEFYTLVEVNQPVDKLIMVKNYLISEEFGKILSNKNFKILKYVNL